LPYLVSHLTLDHLLSVVEKKRESLRLRLTTLAKILDLESGFFAHDATRSEGTLALMQKGATKAAPFIKCFCLGLVRLEQGVSRNGDNRTGCYGDKNGIFRALVTDPVVAAWWRIQTMSAKVADEHCVASDTIDAADRIDRVVHADAIVAASKASVSEPIATKTAMTKLVATEVIVPEAVASKAIMTKPVTVEAAAAMEVAAMVPTEITAMVPAEVAAPVATEVSASVTSDIAAMLALEFDLLIGET